MEILRSFGYILILPADISELVGKKILNTVDFIEETYDRHTALIKKVERNRAIKVKNKVNQISQITKDAEQEINKIQEDFAIVEGSEYEKRQGREIINKASEAANTSIKKSAN